MTSARNNSKNAPADVLSLLETWISIAEKYGVAHKRESQLLARRNTLLGAPSVALAAVVGTSIFAAIQEAAQSVAVRAILAGLSVTSAALTALVTFLNLSGRAMSHRIAWQEYEDIARLLSLLKTSVVQMPPKDWHNLLKGYSERLDSVGRRVDVPRSVPAASQPQVSLGFGPDEQTPRKAPQLQREEFLQQLEALFEQSSLALEREGNQE